MSDLTIQYYYATAKSNRGNILNFFDFYRDATYDDADLAYDVTEKPRITENQILLLIGGPNEQNQIAYLDKDNILHVEDFNEDITNEKGIKLFVQKRRGLSPLPKFPSVENQINGNETTSEDFDEDTIAKEKIRLLIQRQSMPNLNVLQSSASEVSIKASISKRQSMQIVSTKPNQDTSEIASFTNSTKEKEAKEAMARKIAAEKKAEEEKAAAKIAEEEKEAAERKAEEEKAMAKKAEEEIAAAKIAEEEIAATAANEVIAKEAAEEETERNHPAISLKNGESFGAHPNLTPQGSLNANGPAVTEAHAKHNLCQIDLQLKDYNTVLREEQNKKTNFCSFFSFNPVKSMFGVHHKQKEAASKQLSLWIKALLTGKNGPDLSSDDQKALKDGRLGAIAKTLAELFPAFKAALDAKPTAQTTPTRK